MAAVMSTPLWANRGRKILGSRVMDPTGHYIGEISDIVLRMEPDSALFAVVGFGGSEDEHCALRLESLRYDESEDGFVANCTREQLLTATDSTADYYTTLRYWESP
jgi:uncharacterized protein YrrD